MSSPAAVSVDNDFSSCETGVTLWSTNDESAGRLKMVNRVFVDQMRWNHRVDDLKIENLRKQIFIEFYKNKTFFISSFYFILPLI
jgi:hypothetical protein